MFEAGNINFFFWLEWRFKLLHMRCGTFSTNFDCDHAFCSLGTFRLNDPTTSVISFQNSRFVFLFLFFFVLASSEMLCQHLQSMCCAAPSLVVINWMQQLIELKATKIHSLFFLFVCWDLIRAFIVKGQRLAWGDSAVMKQQQPRCLNKPYLLFQMAF